MKLAITASCLIGFACGGGGGGENLATTYKHLEPKRAGRRARPEVRHHQGPAGGRDQGSRSLRGDRERDHRDHRPTITATKGNEDSKILDDLQYQWGETIQRALATRSPGMKKLTSTGFTSL
ncbi:MAG: hypothetical protein ABI867_04255 [Kofleriaceae bacterium]